MSAPAEGTIPRLYIAPPEVEPYRFGLFGSTQQLPTDDIHWLIGGVEWESMAAYVSSEYAAGIFAAKGGGGTPATKALEAGLGTSKAWPFAVYAGVICGSIGYTAQEFEDRTRRILELSAQHAAENALWTGGTSPEQTGLNAAGVATDVTPTAGTAVSPAVAVSLLENWIADHYAGVAQIHAKRGMAALLAEQHQIKFDPDNSKALITPLGTRVVFGGGYDGTGPSANAPGTGKTWMYVTGQTFIGNGPIELPVNYEMAINRATNELFLISEQPYIIGVDGPVAAVLVSTTS